MQYFGDQHLMANKSKSNVTNFCHFQLRGISHLPTYVVVDDILLQEANATMFPGMFIHFGLTWDDHVDDV